VAKKKAIKQQRKHLTPREIEVLKLYIILQTLQIAKTLCIDYETVKTHIRNCVIKLHAEQPRHAIHIATRLGLI
jgi:DNA-binding CsgD family transcriptional regulator